MNMNGGLLVCSHVVIDVGNLEVCLGVYWVIFYIIEWQVFKNL